MNSIKIQRMAHACADIYFDGKKNVSIDLYKHYVTAFIKAYKDKIQ
jgi:hypothetical protein